jgi:hypothetical protein
MVYDDKIGRLAGTSLQIHRVGTETVTQNGLTFEELYTWILTQQGKVQSFHRLLDFLKGFDLLE